MQVKTHALTGWTGAEDPDDWNFLDVVTRELGDQGVETGVGRDLVVIHHHQAD